MNFSREETSILLTATATMDAILKIIETHKNLGYADLNFVQGNIQILQFEIMREIKIDDEAEIEQAKIFATLNRFFDELALKRMNKQIAAELNQLLQNHKDYKE